MLKLGVDKDEISILSMVSLVASLIVMVLISKICFKDNTKVFRSAYKIYFFYFLTSFLNFLFLDFGKNKSLYLKIQGFLILLGCIGNLVFTSYCVFINRMVDQNAGATFLSVMNSLSNVPTLMFNPLFTWSLNFGF